MSRPVSIKRRAATLLLGMSIAPFLPAGVASASPASGRPPTYPFAPFVNHGYLRPPVGPYSLPQIWYSPTPLNPAFPSNDPNQGVYSPIGNSGPGGYAEFVTYLTPSAGVSPVPVVWINQSYANLQIYAGTTQPGGTWPTQGSVPSSLFPNLIGAFEGGFQFSSSQGGFYQNGRLGVALVPGAASIVQYQNGSLQIGSWDQEVSMSPSVVAVRQNLKLLVDNGQLTPLATYNPLVTWGYSLGEMLYTWRSGIGIDANGNLIWVGGPGLSPQTLGQTLIQAGAIRGMQLDINPDWVHFASFSWSNTAGISGQNLLGNMIAPPGRFLQPFWRDFVAVFLKGS